MPQLPGRALEHHPAPHRDGRLAAPARELPAEVERRGVGAAGHVVEGVVVLVEHRVQQLAQPVSAAVLLAHGPSLGLKRRPSARPILLRPARRRRLPSRGAAGRRTGPRRCAGPCGTTSPGGARTAGSPARSASRASCSVSSPRRWADHLAVADRAGRGAALGQAVRRAGGAPPRRNRPANIASTRAAMRSSRVVAVDVDADLDRVRVGVLEAREAGAERPAGQLDDLEGADDPAAVLGQDQRGGVRVTLRQHGVERLRPHARRAPARAWRGPPRRCPGTRTGRGSRGCRAPSRRRAPASYHAPGARR